MAELTELKAEKTTLEGLVTEFHVQKEKLDHVKNEMSSLTSQRDQLEKKIKEREEYNNTLACEVNTKQQKVSDLNQLEAKRDALAVSVSETEEKLSHESVRLEIFESFLGFINSSSITELEKYVSTLPALIAKVKQGQYSPELLRTYIFKTLTGDPLQIFRCSSPACGVRFSLDMFPMPQGYRCPRCDSYKVVIEQEGLEILKEAMDKLKPEIIVVKHINKQHKPTDVDSGGV